MTSPASLLGRLGKGIPKTLTRRQREDRRRRMKALNRQRALAKAAKEAQDGSQ